MSTRWNWLYREFSHDVTSAISVFQNNETAAMLVFQTNPLGVELFSYVNDFFVPRNLHRCWPREWKHSIKRTTNSTGIRANWINCLLYKVLLNLNILPVLSKKCTEPYLGPLHRSYIYIAIYIHVLCKKTVPQESCFFFTLIYICKRTAFLQKYIL